MHAAKHLCPAGMFGILTVLVSQVEILRGEEISICDLRIARGYARGLLVELLCPNQQLSNSSTVKWEYKLPEDKTWKNVTSIGTHAHKKSFYFLKGFVPDTLFYIRAFIYPPGKYTPMARGWTCPRVPPPVRGLRRAGAGPGWLSLRWRKPKEDCGSVLYYLVRYNVLGLPLGPQKEFGIIQIGGGSILLRPSHPCSDDEFCVLLTDGVHPGRNHTVEVRTRRYDSDDHSVGDPGKIIVLADTVDVDSEGSMNAEGCAEHVREHTGHATQLIYKTVALPLWVLVLAGGMSVISLLIGLICVSTSFCRKSSSSSNKTSEPLHLKEMPPMLSLSVLNIYDYPRMPLRKENSTLYCQKL